MKTDPRKTVEVAAGLVFRAGQLLIAQRRATDHLGGLWEFPGGKREADETFEACLQRELTEELGIEVEIAAFVREINHAYPEKTVQLFFYRCELDGEAKPMMGQEMRWVAKETLSSLPLPEADRDLITTLAG